MISNFAGLEIHPGSMGLPLPGVQIALQERGLANIGVHGKPTTLHLEELRIRDVTITTGLVDTYSTPRLLDMLVAGSWTSGPW